MKKAKIAFVCVHNSCRSQMAEAITKTRFAETFEAFSAGTTPKNAINSDAVATINRLYGVDMGRAQYPKKLEELPSDLDFLITLGCGVECPYIPSHHREDWPIDDPTGQSKRVFESTAKTLEQKIETLKHRIEAGEFKPKT